MENEEVEQRTKSRGFDLAFSFSYAGPIIPTDIVAGNSGVYHFRSSAEHQFGEGCSN